MVRGAKAMNYYEDWEKDEISILEKVWSLPSSITKEQLYQDFKERLAAEQEVKDERENLT